MACPLGILIVVDEADILPARSAGSIQANGGGLPAHRKLRISTRVAGFPAQSSMVLAVDQTKPFFLNGPRLNHE
jgi:hypothetical protein